MGNQDEAAIRKVIEAYGDRLQAADLPGIIALYTDDTAVMQPELETTIGKDQLAAAYQGAFANISMDFAFEFDDVLSNGDLAAVRTTAIGTITVKATGQAQPARFRELFVLQNVSGDWKIAQYMFQQMPNRAGSPGPGPAN